MNHQTRFAAASLVIATVILGCTAKSSDESALTSPTFGTTTDATAVTGGVSALAGTCPVTTFVVERKTIKTDASTSFGDGGCVSIKEGLRVEVTGTAQSDGSVKASRAAVVVTTTTTTNPTTYTLIVGNVTALSGACPLLTIAVGEKKAITNASTVFNVRACADYKVGAYVEMSGNAVASTAALTATVVTGRK